MITKPQVLETITDTLNAECKAGGVDPREVLQNVVTMLVGLQVEAMETDWGEEE